MHTYKCGDREKCRAFVLLFMKTLENVVCLVSVTTRECAVDCLQQLRSGPWCLFPCK